jgi:signal peptidase II
VLYFAIAALVVILDQSSKRVIWELYKYSGGAEVIDGFFRFTLSKNRGAVFGILSNAGHLLLVIRIISIGVLAFFAYRMRYAPTHKRVCLGLILGGAFGNLIDHLAAGEVLDFLDVGIGMHRWPTFNVADIAVTVGALLLILGYALHPDLNPKEHEPPLREQS